MIPQIQDTATAHHPPFFSPIPDATIPDSQSSSDHQTSSLSSTCIRHEESFSEFHEADTEDDSITRRTNKQDWLICHSIRFLTSVVVSAIMNAAITIFGMGVGVGLILGDAIRERSRIPVNLQFDHNVNNTTPPSDDTTVVVVRPATPDCRTTIRRVSTRPILPETTIFPSNATMLAQ